MKNKSFIKRMMKVLVIMIVSTTIVNRAGFIKSTVYAGEKPNNPTRHYQLFEGDEIRNASLTLQNPENVPDKWVTEIFHLDYNDDGELVMRYCGQDFIKRPGWYTEDDIDSTYVVDGIKAENGNSPFNFHSLYHDYLPLFKGLIWNGTWQSASDNSIIRSKTIDTPVDNGFQYNLIENFPYDMKLKYIALPPTLIKNEDGGYSADFRITSNWYDTEYVNQGDLRRVMWDLDLGHVVIPEVKLPGSPYVTLNRECGDTLPGNPSEKDFTVIAWNYDFEEAKRDLPAGYGLTGFGVRCPFILDPSDYSIEVEDDFEARERKVTVTQRYFEKPAVLTFDMPDDYGEDSVEPDDNPSDISEKTKKQPFDEENVDESLDKRESMTPLIDKPQEKVYVPFDTDYLEFSLEGWKDRTKAPGKDDVTLTIKATGTVVDKSEYTASFDVENEILEIRPAKDSEVFDYKKGGLIAISVTLEDDTPDTPDKTDKSDKADKPEQTDTPDDNPVTCVSFDENTLSVSLLGWSDKTKAPGKDDITLSIKANGEVVGGDEYELAYNEGTGILKLTPAPNSKVFDCSKGGSIELYVPLEKSEVELKKPKDEPKPTVNEPDPSEPVNENRQAVNAAGSGYKAIVSMNKAVPETKKKKEVVNNLNITLDTKDANGNATGIFIKSVKSTKPKNGIAKVTVKLKGITKPEKKAVKQINKALKKISVKVGM